MKLIAYKRNPNIGIVAKANDAVAFVPSDSPTGFERTVSKTLNVKAVKTNICGTSLIGTMIALNNKGAILPQNAYEEEIKMIKAEMNVGILNDKLTALGNLILLNDYGAIASPVFTKKSIKTIGDVLDCEVYEGKIAGFKTVGSVGIATNKGALVHPLASEEELKWIEEILKVKADVGTVNRGGGFIRTGIIANQNDILVGDRTTGPEIARMELLL
jgi:translation initiation factor 6